MMKRAYCSRISVLLSVVFLLSVSAVSCGAEESAEGGTNIGEKFLGYDTFSEKNIDGKTVKLADYKGKYLFVDFWSTRCGPCVNEMPFIRKVQDRYVGKDFAILGISLNRDIKELKEFVQDKERGLKYPQIWDETGKLGRKYGIRFIPTNFLLDGEGKIIAKNLRRYQLEAKVSEKLGIDSGATHFILAQEQMKKGDMERALEEVKKAVELDPEETEFTISFHMISGQLYAKKDEWDNVIKEYYKAIEKAEGYKKVLVRFELAKLLEGRGKNEMALKEYEKILKAIDELPEEQQRWFARLKEMVKKNIEGLKEE